ncbi:MAG: BatD family protein, partial [Lentimicrobiaceae bacterium]|nr:BatD family protein [Lentimicrobiaceae bacterium]
MRQIKVFIAVLFLGFSPMGKLSAQVVCTARAPQQVAVGQTFQLSFSLNEQAAKLPEMSFPNFSVVAGPSQSYSQSSSYVNGQMSTTTSFTYTFHLVANKEGTHTIPALSFVVNNQTVKSNAVNIQVVAGQNTQQQQQRSQGGTAAQTINKDDFFVRATASNANPYVGEQVIVNYKMYINPQQLYDYHFAVSSVPSSQGFWTYDLTDKKSPLKNYKEVINGKQYVVWDLWAIAAYPQKSGKLTITPLNADLLLQVIVQRQQSNDPFESLFGLSFGRNQVQQQELKLSSNAVSVTARETPSNGKPIDYSGLVGNFTLTSKLSRDTLSANDATNLSVTISGSGNLQYIDKLNIEFPSDIDVQEPSIKDNIKTSLSGISGSRTFEYVLIPRTAGKFTIPAASFSYFDKGKNAYVTLSTDKKEIFVEKGKDGASAYTRASNKKDLQVMGTDIRHIKMNVQLRLAEKPFFLSPTYWVG